MNSIPLSEALTLCEQASNTLKQGAAGIDQVTLTRGACITLAQALAPLFDSLPAPEVGALRQRIKPKGFWKPVEWSPPIRQKLLLGNVNKYQVTGMVTNIAAATLHATLLGEDGVLRVGNSTIEWSANRVWNETGSTSVTFKNLGGWHNSVRYASFNYETMSVWGDTKISYENAEWMYSTLALLAQETHEAIATAIQRMGAVEQLTKSLNDVHALGHTAALELPLYTEQAAELIEHRTK